MFRKKYFTFLLAISLFFISGIVAFAQTAPVTGRVELKKADGTTEPVAGAMVEVFRTDIKSKFPSDKTDKKGNFSFAGLPLGAVFAFSVSGQGIKPEIQPNVKAGTQGLVIAVTEGDGKRWTEEEVRQALANVSTTQTQTGELTEEQKKEQAERQKQIDEINAKNENIKQKTAVIQKSLSEGNAAFNSKNYDLAVAKYEEGYQADPVFVGSAPVLLNNKGAALNNRGTNTYNQAVKSDDPAAKAEGLAKAKKDLEDAVAAYTTSFSILKGAKPADITDPNTYNANKLQALSGLAGVYWIMVQTKNVDSSKTDQVKAHIEEYLAAEPVAEKKARAQMTLAQYLFDAGDSDGAIVEYRKVLEISPDNPDALAGLGLALFNSGVVGNDKDQMQEGLNYMQRFTEVAPETHPLKSSVKDAVDYLKTQEKLTPQKTTKTTTKRKT